MKKLFISTILLGLTAVAGQAKDLTVTVNSYAEYDGFRRLFRQAMTAAGIDDYSEITRLKIINLPNSKIGNEYFSSLWTNAEGVEEKALRDLLKDNLEEIDFSEAFLGNDGKLLPPGGELEGNGFLPNMAELRKVTLPEGITLISGAAFKNCAKLTEINLPSSLIHIGQRAFMGCTKLELTDLPESVTKIQAEAFNESGVRFSKLPPNLIILKNKAFRNTNVSFDALPSTLFDQGSELEAQLFVNCFNITEFTIPDEMTSIKDQTFYWEKTHTEPRTFYCYQSTPPKAAYDTSGYTGVFGNAASFKNVTMYVLKSAVSAYEAVEPYKYMTVVGLPDYHRSIAVEGEEYESQEGSVKGPNIAISTKDDVAYIILTPEEGAKNVSYALDNIQDNRASVRALSVEGLEYQPADASESIPGAYIIPVPAGKSADLYIKYDTADGNTIDNEDLPYSVAVTKLQTEVLIESVNTSNFSQPFSTTGEVIFANAIKFAGEISVEDFTITLVPENNAEGWATGSDYSTALNIPESGLVEQWTALGDDTKVDGFYSGVESIEATLQLSSDSEEDFIYDIVASIPCSGVYDMTITPSEDLAVTVESGSLTGNQLSVYPNLYGTFNNAMGFNINGYMFEQVEDTDDYVINFFDANAEDGGELDVEESYWTNCIGYIPGTYFASSITNSHPVVESSSPKRLAEGSYIDMAYFTRIDLSKFDNYEDATGTQLTVSVEKNGASGDFIFYVNKSATNGSVSTGVEAVDASEEAEAVYFNLQGVRVANPANGIFIERRGNTVKKVVVK